MPHTAVPVALWEQTNKAFLPPGFLLLARAPFREKQRAGSLLLHLHQHLPREAHPAPAVWDPHVGRSVGVSWGVLGLPELLWAQAGQHLLASQVLVLFWGGGAQGNSAATPSRSHDGHSTRCGVEWQCYFRDVSLPSAGAISGG